jgi:hypothetical protein
MKRAVIMFSQIVNVKVMVISMSASLLSSCIIVSEPDYGPAGHPGKAYFGIDYDQDPPWSYWDNNSAVPDNPFFGEYYRTYAGRYDFEYFINPYDYWFGHYEVFVNQGQPGQLYNQPGADGIDTYLLLICNPEGFYMEHWDDCDCYRTVEDGKHIVEIDRGGYRYRIEMQKASIDTRPTYNTPKYQSDASVLN